MEHYVFDTEQEAIDCLAEINGHPMFPVRGSYRGKPAPDDKQKTVRWADAPRELVNGEWCIPRIPSVRLESAGVPQAARDGFLNRYGSTIREVADDEFVVEEI